MTDIDWPISTPDNIIPVDCDNGTKHAILFIDDEYLYAREVGADDKLYAAHVWYVNGRSPYGYGTDLIPPKKIPRTIDVWMVWYHTSAITFDLKIFFNPDSADDFYQEFYPACIIEKITLVHPEDRDNVRDDTNKTPE